MGGEHDLMTSLILELRRGTLILSVLSQLKDKTYGYALVQTLTEKGIAIDAGTLYPLLRRLESQDLLISQWDTAETKPRKYYRRTPYGDMVYGQLKDQWNKIAADMERLMKEEA